MILNYSTLVQLVRVGRPITCSRVILSFDYFRRLLTTLSFCEEYVFLLN